MLQWVKRVRRILENAAFYVSVSRVGRVSSFAAVARYLHEIWTV